MAARLLAAAVAVFAAPPSVSAGTKPEVAIFTSVCGAEAANSAVPMLTSLLFHRGASIDLHVMVDGKARRALRSRFKPAQYAGLEAHVIKADTDQYSALLESALPQKIRGSASTCSLLPAIAPMVIHTDKALYVGGGVTFNDDVSKLYAHFEAFSSTDVLGAVAEQSGWYGQQYTSGIHDGVVLMNLKRMRKLGWVEFVKRTLTASTLPRLGERPVQDMLSSIAALQSPTASVYSIPCQWNVQLVKGSLCDRTDTAAEKNCKCEQPKVLSSGDVAVADGTHPLRGMFSFWKTPPAEVNTYKFDSANKPDAKTVLTQNTVSNAKSSLAEQEGCTPGWAGEDCDECAP